MEGEHKKKIRWLVLSISMIVVVSILTGVLFFGFHQGSIAYYEDRMKSVAAEHAEQIDRELSMLTTAGMTAAHMLSADKIDRAGIIKAASSVLECTDADRVMYCEGNDTGYLWDGRDFSNVDLRTLSYTDELSASSKVQCIFVDSEEADKDATVLVTVPICGGGKSLNIFCPVEKLRSILNINRDSEGHAIAVLTDTDGNFIFNDHYQSHYLTGSNVWENVVQDDEALEAGKQFGNRTTGCFEAISKDRSERRTLAYAPVGERGWVFILGVEQSYLISREMNYWKHSRIVLYLLMGAVFFFLAVFFFFMVLDNKKVEEKDRMLLQKAETDLLTGLTNKLSTERKIKEYIEHNAGETAMMFVFDIDYFKNINDTRGHAFGDRVLSELGHKIGSIFRVTDVVGRIGGDEFAIFLKYLKNTENIMKEAHKLEEFFKTFTVDDYPVTASIGVAVYPSDGKDFQTLYNAADKALYVAKRRGRNQLAFFEDKAEEE